MTQLETRTSGLTELARAVRSLANGRPWLHALRREALDRFEAIGLPTSQEEEWRQTNLAPIGKTTFTIAEPDFSIAAEKILSKYSFANETSAELVFVNGHFWAARSRIGKLPRNVRVLSIAEALRSGSGELRTNSSAGGPSPRPSPRSTGARETEGPAPGPLAGVPGRGAETLLEDHLAQYASIERNPFVALNTGFIHDGAVVHFGKSAHLDRPVHLIFISTASAQPAVSHPRVLIVADENAEAALVETYVGANGVYFTNAVTELIAADNARIDHCKVQQESAEAFHIATLHAQLGRSASFISHAATTGAKLSRNDLNVYLNGEGAEATLNGMVVIGGDQHADNHTLLHHEKANCPSHELYKYVLDGRSNGVFKGKIFVQKDAQKTDSKQTSKSLLLTDEAKMYSQPALQIYADDVKCTHGSTTGPVDEEMVFYLRSRGVGLDAARHLLTYAFAADITRRIRIEPVRRLLEDYMAAQHGLPMDLRITDLGHAHDKVAV